MFADRHDMVRRMTEEFNRQYGQYRPSVPEGPQVCAPPIPKSLEQQLDEANKEIARLFTLLEKIEEVDAKYRKQGTHGDLIRVMTERRHRKG